MAGTTNNQFNSHLYLSPNQQDLLMAALNSNNPNGNQAKSSNFPAGQSAKSSGNSQQQQFSLDGLDPTFFPPDATSADFSNFNFEESPYDAFLDGEAAFEFDPNDTSDLLIGSLPGDQKQDQGQESTSPTQRSVDGDTETGDKRKSPGDDEEDGEGGGKRREGEDKTAKKPGRKPLTSEPTTKRKAQNRAAQRAFRERKEKHLKDLESKVTELQKASDAANHENGLLRAQVERLQMELREYRKRLSLNSTGMSRPAVPGGFPSLLSHNSPPSSNFQFEFPRFGALPGSQIFSNGSLSGGDKGSPTTAKSANQNSVPGVLARQPSAGRSVSPTSQQNGARSDKASPASGSETYNSPGMNGLSGGTTSGRGSTSSSTGPQRVFQFNSHSNSSTNDSPSASSVSQYGANSSCGTSPEPSHNSPGNDKLNDKGEGFSCAITEGETSFCEKLNMACGNPRNPIPRAMSQSNGTPAPAAANSNSTDNSFGIDWLATQNNNQFNPTLFGDYRESQAAVVGEGDFTGGFFNEAFPTADFGSPFNFDGQTQSPNTSKSNPMESIEKVQDGDDEEVVPGEDPNSLLSCHKIWDKLQNRPDFKDGTIDIDGLCTELRAKARCSESGVVVDSKDVEAALKRLPDKA